MAQKAIGMASPEVRAHHTHLPTFERLASRPLSSISVDEIQTPLEGPLDLFRPDTTDRRRALASTTIALFGLTKGDYGYVVVLMDWFRIHKASDLQTTFKNFGQAGGWNCFREDEQMKITNAYFRGHENKKNAPRGAFFSMGETFNIQLRCFADTAFTDGKRYPEFSEDRIKELETFEDIKTAIAQDFAQRHAQATF